MFCQWCDQMLVGPVGIKAAGIGRRVGAYILDAVLFFVTLIIGYIIWWLFTLRHGQTPGKQLLGIRVMRADGTRSDWGWTFLREFVIKLLVLSQLGFGNCLRKRLRLLPFFRSVDVGGWQPWDENGMWSGWKGKNETSWND